MPGDVEVKDVAAVVGEHDENEEARRRNREEIERD